MVIKGNYEQRTTQTTNVQEDSNRKEAKAINTTIMLLSQKINFIVRNEKILSKNILVLNEKIRKIEEKNTDKKDNNFDSSELNELRSDIESLNNKIDSFKADINAIQSELNNYATKTELKEIKYLLDAINPLEFVTYKQLREMLNK